MLAGIRGNEVETRELQRRIVYGMALVVVGLFVVAVIEVHLTGGVVLENVMAQQ